MTTPAAAVDHDDGTRTYSAPNPATGEIVKDLPNVTSVLPTPLHIHTWYEKMVLLGTAFREDLQVQVCAAHLLPEGPPRNGELRRLAEQAKNAGQVVEKKMIPADRGTGYHALTERLDELVPNGRVDLVDGLGLPRPVAEIARSYVAAMAGVSCDHREATVISFEHRFGGTCDFLGLRFTELEAWAKVFDLYDLGRGSFIGDAKFGTVHESVALQLAGLALADSIWDPVAGTHTPLPADLRRDVGFAFHPGQGLVPVDLTGAADAFLGALAVRHYEIRGLKPLRPALRHPPAEVGSNGAGPGPASPAGADLPVHISTPLAAVVQADAIPDYPEFDVDPDPDPFAGLPDDDGRPQIDRAAKRSWLVDRLRALAEQPGGLDQVAARWPVVDGTPVPTFQATDDHTAGQLAAIEAAIDDAETELRARFPDIDPTDPAFIVVANDDPRVTALAGRIAALPPDLQARVAAGAQPANVPNLRTGRITEAHLAAVEPLVAAVEPEAQLRADLIAAAVYAVEEKGVPLNVVLGAVGVATTAQLHSDRLHRFHTVCDAIQMGLLVEKSRGLIVDQPQFVVDQYGGAGKVLTAARKVAKANGWPVPASSDAALADPVMTALLAVV